MMKYNKEQYLNSEIYGCQEDEISCYREKVVKCRKTHTCVNCQKTIEVGEHCLNESGFMYGKAVSSYTCLPCIEKWLEESGRVNVGGGIND